MSKYRIQLNKGWIFNAMYALLMVLVFIRYVFQINYPPEILLALVMLMVCAGDRRQILATCMVCIPLTTAFQYTYALLFAIIMYVVKYWKEIHIDLSVIPILMLVMWELLHGLTGPFSPKRFVAMFLPYLLCGLLMWQRMRKQDTNYIVTVFALSVCIMCITLAGTALYRAGFQFSKVFRYMQRLGSAEENSGQISLVINPNSLGVMCTIAVSSLLQRMTTGRKSRSDMILVIILLVSGGLSLSRTYLVLLMIMVALFWLAQEGGAKKKLRLLISMMAIALITVGLLCWLFPSAIEGYIRRFKVSDMSSGRSYLFNQYNAFLLDSPEIFFYGIGLTNFSQRIVSMTGLQNVPHNGFQEAVAAWGLVGAGLFLAFLCCLLWRGSRTGKRKKLINYIPLLLLMAKIQAGQMLTSDYTMLLLPFCYLSIAHDFTPQETNL